MKLTITRLLTFILSQCVIINVYAGTGWHVNLHNNSTAALTVSFGGNDSWYCNDFCGTSRIEAGQSKTFYTESRASVTGSAIQGINLTDGNGQKAHVEFIMGAHTRTGTNIATTYVYAKAINPNACTSLDVANITATVPQLFRVESFTGGSKTLCGGYYGTVDVTLYFTPP
ncbi:hypothetical protein [Endozoicomonas arenosclerae]|uniref:hypothetical protein n=1 Tax=Endozoicomonas arenosclerae TaxID=1633495 RepID=UPI000781AD2B|nr:hypothetical protein [Endozoicomonas arenosclerae]